MCLLAMSEGVGDYIRDLAKAIEDKLSPSERQQISEDWLPALVGEYRKLRGPGMYPVFEFSTELDGQSFPLYLCDLHHQPRTVVM